MEAIEKKAEEKGEKAGQWVGEQIDTLPAKFRERTSDFQGTYQQTLVDFYRDYKTEGFRIGLPVLDLEDVFVPLKVETETPENIPGAMVSDQSPSKTLENQEIWNFLAAIPKEPVYRCMAVIAPPGYGKTTLLKHLTLTYAKNDHGKYKAPKFVPVLLYLRDVREQITSQQPPTLPQLITDHLKIQPAFAELNPPPNWFQEQLKLGNCLVMLDGLDEVADEKERISVSQWVNQQIITYRKTAFILTSRPYGYTSAPVDEVGVILQVLPFTLEQMKQFIHSWYLQTEIRCRAGRNNSVVRAEAKTNANDLIERIINNRAIADMAKNPLLITMIATVHYSGSTLPGRRVELYQKICELLLGTRQAAKKIKAPLTVEQSKSVLQVLALDLMRRKSRSFTVVKVQNLIASELQKIVGTTLITAEFLEQIKDVSGLLVEREQGILEFAHLSFQEYLAAAEVKELQQENILITNFDNPWWAETIRLYAAQSDATSLIQAALKNQSVVSLTLAYDCLKESKKVESNTQRQLEQILEAGLASENPQIAKIAAQVRLARRLKSLLRINNTQEIDQSYITYAEYKLFMTNNFGVSEASADPSLLPTNLKSTDATKPITGISFQAANRFCAWLSINSPLRQSTDKLTNYRLPTEDEARQYLAKDNKDLSCWTQENRNGGVGIRIVQDQWPTQYIQLLDYLEAGQWREADEETTRIMLKVANRKHLGWLDIESIKKFPCSDLRTIDQLWVQYSEGRFGLSVQKRIYEDEGQNFVRLFNRMGWRKEEDWVEYKDFTFVLEDCPEGNLPTYATDNATPLLVDLFSRAETCKL
ncbi:GUN4 domain-containing protein [Nostoc sp.]